MLCKKFILLIGIFVFLQQTEGYFNIASKHASGDAISKSCKNMSKSFDNIGKSLDKILVNIDALTLDATFDKKKNDFTAVKKVMLAYKTTFDLFGNSAISSAAKPTAVELMNDIMTKFTSLTTDATSFIKSLESIDTSLSTTLALTFSSAEAQKSFVSLVDGLFSAVKTLVGLPKVTDAKLAEVLVAPVDLPAILKFLGDFQLYLMNVAAQIKYIETQYAAVKDHQTAAKKVLESFTKGLSAVTKRSKDNKDKGKKDWIDVLEKELSTQNANGIKIQKALNLTVNQTATVSASAKIDAFYAKFKSFKNETTSAFSAILLDQYNFAVNNIVAYFTNYEVSLLSAHVTSVAQALFVNVDGKGQNGLKNMTKDFTTMFSSYQANIYACFEDFATYVPFTTEFVKIQMIFVKAHGDAAINYLPACLKQISKKTSAIYTDAMYNTCLVKYADLLESGYDSGLGATLTGLANQITNDEKFIIQTYTDCQKDADKKLTTKKNALGKVLLGRSSAVYFTI